MNFMKHHARIHYATANGATMFSVTKQTNIVVNYASRNAGYNATRGEHCHSLPYPYAIEQPRPGGVRGVIFFGVQNLLRTIFDSLG